MDELAALAARIQPAPSGLVTQAALARTMRRILLIAATDSPRSALAGEPPSAIFADTLADGTAAVVHAARDAHAELVLVDAGCRKPLPAPWIRLADDDRSGAALVIGLAEATGLDVLLLGAFGAPVCLLTGAILAAASLHIPVILDGEIARAAAAAAVATQPRVDGYLVSGLPLGHGEGTGAAILLSRLHGMVSG